MTTSTQADQALVGRLDGDGMVIEHPDNDDAWVHSEYEDGWVLRKLLGAPKDEFDDMIHPYYQQCCCCGRWADLMMWGKGSPYCPGCEQAMDHVLRNHRRVEGIHA